MTTDPHPTSQLPDPPQRETSRHFDTLDPVRAHWPGAPFPPPLLGLPYQVVDLAAAHWLTAVHDLVHGGEQSLNALFAESTLAEACRAFALPEEGLRVIPIAGAYTLGTLRSKDAGASLSSLFGAPSIIQISRLNHAAAQLGS